MDLSSRRPGPDVVRALAMAGVVLMNYHGYFLLRGAERPTGALADLLDPFRGPLATRFAATFVLTAGVGVTLMTRSSVGDAARTRDMRWLLVRRGALLYLIGLPLDEWWPGTILPFYGAMFVVAAGLFTLRARWVLCVGAGAAIVAWLLAWWRFESDLAGRSMRWMTHPDPFTPHGLLFDVTINGTHPLLPWLAFFCVGIVLGRLLGTTCWRPAAVAAGVAMYTIGTLAGSAAQSARAEALLSTQPLSRSGAYVASALGTALVAFATVSWIADRFASAPLVDALQRAGQMSLTIYLAHIFVFLALVDWFDLIDPGSLAATLLFVAAYWSIATALAVAYQRRFGRGPAERVYRALTA